MSEADYDAVAGVNMREVAKRAGVATSSVSRVLADHPDVSRAMRQRVMEAVSALGYERNVVAQSLRKGTTLTVGFIVGDISNPLVAEIALGAETRLRAAGYTMLLVNSGSDPRVEAGLVSTLRQRRVDGLLLSIADERSQFAQATLDRSGLPFVLIDRDGPPGGSAAVNDHDAGITAAAEHLISLGHRRIALITGPAHVRPSSERARALRRACRRSKATVFVRGGSFKAEHGLVKTRELLESAQPPTAILAGGNQILTGVLQAIQERGLRVPEDLSLVTCDDVPLAPFLTPPIDTIYREPALLGEEGAGLLLELISGHPPRRVSLPTRFRAAHSSGPPAAGLGARANASAERHDASDSD